MAERNSEFGRRLLASIKARNISQKDFAQVIGSDPVTLNRYINQGRVPEWQILVRMSVWLKKSVDWLLLGEDAYKNISGPSVEDWESLPLGTRQCFLDMVIRWDKMMDEQQELIVGLMHAAASVAKGVAGADWIQLPGAVPRPLSFQEREVMGQALRALRARETISKSLRDSVANLANLATEDTGAFCSAPQLREPAPRLHEPESGADELRHMPLPDEPAD